LKNLQVIPHQIEKQCFYPNQKYIKLIDEAIGFSCMCEMEEADEDCSEKYIRSG